MKKNTSHLHLEALSRHALSLLPKLPKLVPQGILGGGTAAALQLGHRKSYDFDIFISKPISKSLLYKANAIFGSVKPLVDNREELTLSVGQTKVTVITYPFKNLHPLIKTDTFPFYDLRDLASSKAYTIGRRGAWRDYVDIFAILRRGLRLEDIIADAEKRFGEYFNAKLLLEQLTFFEDINDFSIEWLRKKYSTEEVKDYLQKAVSQYLLKTRV